MQSYNLRKNGQLYNLIADEALRGVPVHDSVLKPEHRLGCIFPAALVGLGRMRWAPTLGELQDRGSKCRLSVTAPSWSGERVGRGSGFLPGTLIHCRGWKLGDVVNLEKE